MLVISNTYSDAFQRIGQTLLSGALVLALWTSLGHASPVGTWQTEPDKRGQTAHVVAEPCGAGVCGTMTRVFDPQGNQIDHPNVGKRLFWNMVPNGDQYAGRAYVPALDIEVDGTIELDGDTMKVGGCAGPVCQSQTWLRID